MLTKKKITPSSSVLAEEQFDYSDCFSEEIIHPIEGLTVSHIARSFILSSPKWSKYLFKLRKLIFSIFRFKSIESNKIQDINSLKIETGQYLGHFIVYHRTNSEVVIGKDDKHLDFRISIILLDFHEDINEIIISTVVNYHNLYGRLYFAIVIPFHKLIIKSMLKSLVGDMSYPKL